MQDSEIYSGVRYQFLDSQYKNSILNDDLEAISSTKHVTLPALFINEQEFMGHLKLMELISVICMNFEFKPQICQSYLVKDSVKTHKSIANKM